MNLHIISPSEICTFAHQHILIVKIITWNCNMAFRKKARHILAYGPDLIVVPECECPDKLIFGNDVPKPSDMLWFGANKNKGLAILSYGDYRIKVLEQHNEALKMIIPIAVTGGAYDFNLFAIWANNPTDIDGQYVEQIWKAIHHYDDLLITGPSILTGDFNSNTIWDKKRRVGNHSNVVKYLSERDIHSAYHLHHQQEQGKEQHPTFYLYRNQLKPYHMDYCFLSAPMATQIQSVEVGDYDFWIKHSDHVPLIVRLHEVNRNIISISSAQNRDDRDLLLIPACMGEQAHPRLISKI